ncbi:hypothetical protein N5T79_06425 [Aliarcobacter cryaerophilus]|uniref:hypothetical protein n=1 Tax=Aliarcobacter cryaerophilus TaxID=28198 RepID=UPI0021B64E62|nr:hypothetical protein [Aliarcobacter cryaerophilus]MCT7528777.1 hypothetical protein [Aliarcobacter cryaerophilus]
MSEKDYERLLIKEFSLTQTTIWCKKKLTKINSNSELYKLFQEDRKRLLYLMDKLVENRSHHLIKDCFKEKNKLILSNYFVKRLYMQNPDRPLQNQYRVAVDRVYKYLINQG